MGHRQSWHWLSRMVSHLSEGAPLVIVDTAFEPVELLSVSFPLTLVLINFIIFWGLLAFASLEMKVRGTCVSDL